MHLTTLCLSGFELYSRWVPLVCRRISVASLSFIAGFPQTDFDTRLVNFFLKLVCPVILKELQSNFLISALRLFQK